MERPESLPRAWSASTDAAGKFSLRGLPAQPVRVIATHPDFGEGLSAPLSLDDRADNPQTVTVSMAPLTLVEGRVLDAERGQPLADATVIAAGGLRQRRTTTDSR